MWEFYGSTEGGFTRIAPTEALAHPGSVGRPPDGTRIEIRDPAAGNRLPTGEIGTVWLHDPRAERFEYWGDEAKTARAWDGDAFTVGDHGHLDSDGYLYLAGRPSDLIISGGVNVYPAEVEDMLMGHPDVAEVLVYGASDEDWGQQVRALIVAAEGAHPDPRETAGMGALTARRVQMPPGPRTRERAPQDLHGEDQALPAWGELTLL